MSHINKIIELSKRNNNHMKEIRRVLVSMKDSDTQIIDYHYGEKDKDILELFNTLVDDFKNSVINNNLININDYLSQTDNPDVIKKLNESKKLEEESLQIIDEIHQLIKTIKGSRLNEALRDEPLRYRALRAINKNNLNPNDDDEPGKEVLRNVRNERAINDRPRKGGRRKTCNKKNIRNNKKYQKKYVSKKNKKTYL